MCLFGHVRMALLVGTGEGQLHASEQSRVRSSHGTLAREGILPVPRTFKYGIGGTRFTSEKEILDLVSLVLRRYQPALPVQTRPYTPKETRMLCEARDFSNSLQLFIGLQRCLVTSCYKLKLKFIPPQDAEILPNCACLYLVAGATLKVAFKKGEEIKRETIRPVDLPDSYTQIKKALENNLVAIATSGQLSLNEEVHRDLFQLIARKWGAPEGLFKQADNLNLRHISEVLTQLVYADLWRRAGTIARTDEVRVDIQGTTGTHQNLQIQDNRPRPPGVSTTFATVLLNLNLNVFGETTEEAEARQRHVIRMVKYAFLLSARTGVKCDVSLGIPSHS